MEVNRALVAHGWENVVVSAGGRPMIAKAFGGALDVVEDVRRYCVRAWDCGILRILTCWRCVPTNVQAKCGIIPA